MSLWLQILLWVLAAGIAVAVLAALVKTKRPVRSLVGSGAQGLCALAAVNIAGAFTSVSIGLNLFTGLSCVVLGIPGVVAMLVVKLIMNL
ncbi:MAG TPA: pro-sigmaK processing inhibitor BofA family protein [Firmicutes bacterium]|nr:pro-sigmaK processing inhibitor BofA family protein [Bacillota bacterium]